MSKCDVLIHLERENATYGFGEEVRGRLVVRPQTELNCQKITLVCYWHTRGRGSPDIGQEAEMELSGAVRLVAGKELDFPIQFVLPMGPASHGGSLVQVEWVLKARVDIPWGIDATWERTLTLTGGKGGAICLGDRYIDLDGTETIRSGSKSAAMKAGQVFGGAAMKVENLRMLVTLFVVASALLFPLIFYFAVPDLPRGFIIPLLAFDALFIWVFSRKVLANLAAGRKLGPVEFSANPKVLRPGEKLQAKVAFTARGAATLEKITVTLLGREEAPSGSGKNRKHHQQVVAALPVERPLDIPLTLGKKVEEVFELTIPSDAFPSFESANNQMRWVCEAHIVIREWPDWKGVFQLAVLPQGT